MEESAVCLDVQKCMQYFSFLLLRRELKNVCFRVAVASCWRIQAARVLFFSLAPLESSSNVCFPDWMLSSCCPLQTSSFCVLSKTASILFFAQVTYRYKNSRRGGVLRYGKYAHTQQPNSHTQQVATPKNQKGKTKKLQQTLQTAVFDDNGDLGVKSLQTLFMWHNCDPQLSALCSS